MSFRAKIIIDDIEVNVLRFNFRFKQGANENGHPCEIPTFRGLEVLIESRSDLNLAEWSFAPDMAKQVELHIYPVNLDGRTRRLYFFDSHLIGWKHNFSSTGTLPLTEQLTITAAGVKDSTTEEEYSMYWRTTYPDKGATSTTIDEGPDILSYHIENLEGEIIEKKEIDIDEEIILVVESEHAVGEIFQIDLDSSRLDFEHNGVALDDDILEFKITKDIEEIHLKAIAQQN